MQARKYSPSHLTLTEISFSIFQINIPVHITLYKKIIKNNHIAILTLLFALALAVTVCIIMVFIQKK